MYVGANTRYIVGAQDRSEKAADQRQEQIDIAIEGINKLTELQTGLCAYADASQDWALLITDINAPDTLRQIADPHLRQAHHRHPSQAPGA